MNCLRCGTSKEKRLICLMESRDGGLFTSEFYVCHNRKKCRTRQQALRPARMKVNESDTPLRRSIGDMSPIEREIFSERLKDLRKKLMEDAERLPNGI